jgi:Transposase DDE domain
VRLGDIERQDAGMKLHLVYNPHTDHPLRIEITPANVNDVTVGRAFPLEPGATLVFDKGYCDHGWWRRLQEAGCRFVTRPKTNMRLDAAADRPLPAEPGQGFVVLRDEIGRHSSKNGSRLDFPLRRLTVQTDDGRELTLITNDLQACALEIGRLYKSRWDIELLFRWIKQHLRIRSFLGRSETAIRIQACPRESGDPDGDDRLSAPAHRRPPEPIETHRHPLRQAGEPLPVHPQAPRPSRPCAASQSKPSEAERHTRTTGPRLCLIFPGQPCAFAGMMMESGDDGGARDRGGALIGAGRLPAQTAGKGRARTGLRSRSGERERAGRAQLLAKSTAICRRR